MRRKVLIVNQPSSLLIRVCTFADKLFQLRCRLGPTWTDPGPDSDLGHPQCLFESQAHDTLCECFQDEWFHTAVTITSEEFKPRKIKGSKDGACLVYFDSMDGTTNTQRWQTAGNRGLGEPVTAVIALALERENLTFGDIQIGVILDLRTGEIWAADIGGGAYRKVGEQWLPLNRSRAYDRLKPLIACEFYRRINWATRLLIPYACEWADMASSAMNILRVCLGEADLFVNNVLPNLSNDGQSGHELGAIMPFIRQLGCAAVDMRTGKPLAETPFTFDGLTPVMIGVDQETVTHYQGLICNSLDRITTYGGRAVGIRPLLAALVNGLPTIPCPLRPLAKT